jgi:hypothetical protein
MDEALQVKEKDYEITLSTGEGTPCVSFSGNMVVRNAMELNIFFGQVHDELCARSARSVDVDERQLKFINSTGFKPLIYWVSLITELAEPAQYQLRVLSSARQRWQANFLNALSCFAPSVVSVQTDPQA